MRACSRKKKKKWLDVADMGFFTDKNVVNVSLFTKKKKSACGCGFIHRKNSNKCEFLHRKEFSEYGFFTERSVVVFLQKKYTWALVFSQKQGHVVRFCS